MPHPTTQESIKVVQLPTNLRWSGVPAILITPPQQHFDSSMQEDGNQFTPETPTEDLVGRSASHEGFSVRLAVILWEFFADMAAYLTSGIASFLLLEQMREVETEERTGRKQFFRGVLSLILGIVFVIFLVRIGQDIRIGLADWSTRNPVVAAGGMVATAVAGAYVFVYGYCEQGGEAPRYIVERRRHLLLAVGIGTLLPVMVASFFEYEGQMANLFQGKATVWLVTGILFYVVFLFAAIGTIIVTASVAIGMAEGVFHRGAVWAATTVMSLGGLLLLWGWFIESERVLDTVPLGSGMEPIQGLLLAGGWCLSIGFGTVLTTLVREEQDS